MAIVISTSFGSYFRVLKTDTKHVQAFSFLLSILISRLSYENIFDNGKHIVSNRPDCTVSNYSDIWCETYYILKNRMVSTLFPTRSETCFMQASRILKSSSEKIRKLVCLYTSA